MIITLEKIKEFVSFPENWTDAKILMKLQAVEQTIRAYTNNNFQHRGFRVAAHVIGGVFAAGSPIPFSVGDTVQVSESQYNNGLYTVSEVKGDTFAVAEDCKDDDFVLCTLVRYPADVVACAVDLMAWEVQSRDKVGVQSETISRHSVTYFNQDAANQVMGYPVALLGCLKAYRKARC